MPGIVSLDIEAHVVSTRTSFVEILVGMLCALISVARVLTVTSSRLL